MTDSAFRRYVMELWIIGACIFTLAVLQVVFEWKVDRAEYFALRAARDYELTRLVKKTRELNAAALAIIRDKLNNPCVTASENPPQGRTPKSKIENGIRPSAPLPAIPLQRDQPERARHQPD